LIHVPLAEDLDRDGMVNLIDYAIFAANWGPPPPPELPPEPNIMTWATEPCAVSPYAIAMVATTATSTDGSGVEYYFQNTTIGGHDSGWQMEPNYTDTGLSPDTGYGYKVKTRNTGNHEETEWSQERFATTLPPDTTPPQPDPAEWQEQPYATSPTSIRMVAKDANDPSGVEYYFKCTSHPNDYSSNWQDNSIYEVTGLPEDVYSFVVRARDKSPNHNTTGDSNEVTVDLKPPTPDPMLWDMTLDANGFDGTPREIEIPPGGTFYHAVTMRADPNTTDESGYWEFYFHCKSESTFDSGWIHFDEPPYTYTTERIGRSHQGFVFEIKARDMYGNETGWSQALPAQPPPP